MIRTGFRLAFPLALAAVSLLAAIVLLAMPAKALAAGCTDSWIKAISGQWSNAEDWSAGRVPNSSDEVCITAEGEYTVTTGASVSVHSLTLGTSGTSGPALEISGQLGNTTLTLGAPSLVEPTGHLILHSPSGGGYTGVIGALLIDHGTVTSIAEGSAPNYLESSLETGVEESAKGPFTGTLEVASGVLDQDQGTTTTNEGDIKVAPAGLLNLTSAAGRFINDGTVANEGTIAITTAGWTQSGGSQTGNAVALNGASLIDSAGAGQFRLSAACKLSGTIPAGQTVTVTGAPSVNSTTTLSGGAPVTNDGTLVLDSPSGSGYAQLQGEKLVNDGTLRTQVEGASLDYLEVGLENAGAVEVKSGELHQDQATTTTNEAKGTIKVEATGKLVLTSATGKLVNEGTVTDEGSISITSATWTQSGGSETGNAVALSGSLVDRQRRWRRIPALRRVQPLGHGPERPDGHRQRQAGTQLEHRPARDVGDERRHARAGQPVGLGLRRYPR